MLSRLHQARKEIALGLNKLQINPEKSKYDGEK